METNANAAHPQRESATDLSRLARMWWLCLLGAVIGGGGLAGVLAVRPESYTSTAVLLFSSIDLTSGSPSISEGDEKRLINSQADVILSDTVLDEVAQKIDATRVYLKKSIEIITNEDSNVIRLSVEVSSPERSQSIASAVATAYAEYSRRQGNESLVSQADALTESIDTLTQRITDTGEGADADIRRLALVNELTSLTQQQEQLRLAARTYPGQVSILSAPDRPTSPSSLAPFKGALIGGILGAIGGLLLAVAWVYSRRRNHHNLRIWSPDAE